MPRNTRRTASRRQGSEVLECASVMVRAAERIVGAILCEGGLGAGPQKILRFYALKCVLRASQVPFCACIQYIPTCQLPSLFSGFRSNSTTYGALASGCAEIT